MIKEFLEYSSKVKNLSENTINSYRKDLSTFTQWARSEGLRWSTIKKKDVDNFSAYLHERQKSPATIARHITSIRQLFQWAMNEGILQSNAARYCSSPRKEYKLPSTIDQSEIERYLASEASTDQSRTIHALAALIVDTGIRLQEALDIRIEDIDATNQTIKIHGKGRKERLVYYSQLTMRHCSATCNKRRGYLIDEASQIRIRYMMYSEMGCKVHPHALRHTFATTMLNNGASIMSVQSILGHASVQTTERYCALSANNVRRAYNKFH